MTADVCNIKFQLENEKVANIPFGGKTFSHEFKTVIPALKGKNEGFIFQLPGYITPTSLKEYFIIRKAIHDATDCLNGTFELPPHKVTFEMTKIAELMLDVDFFNKINWKLCNIDLDSVSYSMLGPLTTCLCLNLILEKCKADVAIESGYERIGEKMPNSLISPKLATFCKESIPKVWKLYMETPETRANYCRWYLRMDKFLKSSLGRYLWETDKETRKFIVTILQIPAGKRDSAISRQYAIRRQDQTTGRSISEVWCQHDKQKKNHKNCDDLPVPCTNCKGVLSWIQNNMPSDADDYKAQIEAETQRIWDYDPKYNKIDYDDILNGSEIDAGYDAQLAEVHKMAKSIVDKRRTKQSNT
jgi:hypothetical protein